MVSSTKAGVFLQSLLIFAKNVIENYHIPCNIFQKIKVVKLDLDIFAENVIIVMEDF